MKSKLIFFILAIITSVAGMVASSGIHPPHAHAVPTSSFNPGRIIDDGVFFNSNTLTAGEIQAFLNSKVPVCDTWHSAYVGASGTVYNPPFTCLKDYSQAVPNQPADSYCAGNITAATLTAAQILAAVSNACSINPEVLIVLLQKEQGLVTDTWPISAQYKTATGYGCPDTAPCDAQYFGFFNQVYNAAHQFQRYRLQSSQYNYRANGTFYVAYNPSASCGGSNVYIQNAATAALYNYTPYQPNAAALAAGYGTAPPCGAYGNRNFWLYFNDWFGSPYMPTAFKSSTSPIYMYVSGYKVIVPHMGILQDFGISPQSIQTISQSAVDIVPAPDQASGISPVVTTRVKSPSDSDADGGSVYLVSIYSRHQFATMTQYYGFGYSDSDISYLPLGFLQSIPNGGMLSDFVYTPQNVSFKVGGGVKKLIFDYQTYISLNPSDNATRLSYYAVDLTPSGVPISNRDVLMKYSDSESVTLYLNGNYYGVPNYDTYSCWGFDSSLGTPIYRLADNSYVAPVTTASNLSCLVGNGTSTTLLSRNQRYSLPAGYGISAPQTDSGDVQNLANKLPNAGQLKQYIKSDTGAAVWYLSAGKRKVVPTLANFNLLGLNASSVDTISQADLSSLPLSGIKLGNGKSVKASDNAAVYTIYGNNRLAYLTSDDFLAYRNDWNDIETYSPTLLDPDYPVGGSSVSKYFYDSTSSKLYLIDLNGCFALDSTQLQAAYNKDPATVSASQNYTIAAFPKLNLSSCSAAGIYVKSSDSPAVYMLTNGNKQAFSTWDALVRQSGTSNPRILTLSPSTMATFPIGSNIN